MTGTRAMNGETRTATTAISPMALRQPGSARAVRAPSASRATTPASPPWRTWTGSRTSRSATTTARKETALAAKARV